MTRTSWIIVGLVVMAAIGLGWLQHMDPGGLFNWLAVGLILYFVPTALAFGRRHPQRLAITGLNVLLGWTFIGWVAAFVWSLTAQGARAE